MGDWLLYVVFMPHAQAAAVVAAAMTATAFSSSYFIGACVGVMFYLNFLATLLCPGRMILPVSTTMALLIWAGVYKITQLSAVGIACGALVALPALVTSLVVVHTRKGSGKVRSRFGE